MPIELYLAFVAATAVLIALPGPVVTMVVAESIAFGARPALVIVAGTSTATAVHLSLVALGMNSFMLVLSEWFEWLRWGGVAYLVYLGARQWLARPETFDGQVTPPKSARRLFVRGFLVNLSNPKVLLFYAAFFPQFLDPSLPAGPQLLILCPTFLGIAVLIDGCYVGLGGRARRWLEGQRNAIIRNRISGGMLIGAGLGLALIKRD